MKDLYLSDEHDTNKCLGHHDELHFHFKCISNHFLDTFSMHLFKFPISKPMSRFMFIVASVFCLIILQPDQEIDLSELMEFYQKFESSTFSVTPYRMPKSLRRFMEKSIINLVRFNLSILW